MTVTMFRSCGGDLLWGTTWLRPFMVQKLLDLFQAEAKAAQSRGDLIGHKDCRTLFLSLSDALLEAEKWKRAGAPVVELDSFRRGA